jgi:hypothetical protein
MKNPKWGQQLPSLPEPPEYNIGLFLATLHKNLKLITNNIEC